MRNILFLTFFSFFIGFYTYGQEINASDTTNDIDRPTVALVLAGGGARGFSHIPVIELIEELGIPIDMVIGTSAGAIIGGLYSAGYTGEEIADEMLSLDWPSLFQDSTTRPLESALGWHSLESNILNVQLSQDLSLDLGKGLLTGQYIYNKLKSSTVKIPSYIHFDSLLTPFRATAVDLLSGELVIMEQGDLVEAIRSSMSIPAVFEPFPVNGRYYIDGFARNNLPIQVAKDLGYDIIIAVEITDRMSDDADEFNSNPLTALNQVMALQQVIVVSDDYELADLIIYPDIYEFGQMDYASTEKIYEKGKKEAEKYREDLIALRSKIFKDSDTETKTELIEDTELLTDDGFSFTYVQSDEKRIYTRQNTYSALPEIQVEAIVLKNILESDRKLLLSLFDDIKTGSLGEDEINLLLHKAYNTGNYILVTSRIDKRTQGNTLELEFFQKQQKTVHLNTSILFEGTLSSSSTWALSPATTLQFRDLNDNGGLISIRGSYLHTTGIEVLFMQPITEKVFFETKANIFSTLDVKSSGFEKIEVTGSQLRHANFSIGNGVFFSPEHKLFTELGLRWVDSSLAYNENNDDSTNQNMEKPGYAFDFSMRYTFSTLNYDMFPTRGFYNNLKGVGVMPLFDPSAPVLFDAVSTDFAAALSFSRITSFVLNTFIGTNITGSLTSEPELITKYGFTTYDRTFFPHIMQRHTYGIHKFALKFDFQFQPKNQLTILGGQFFTGIGASAGGVWNSYEEIFLFEDITFQVSALTGLRIKDSIGVILRAGGGTYNNNVLPYVSLDFMVKHF